MIIEIGEKATDSPQEFLGTIFHEFVHVLQMLDYRDTMPEGLSEKSLAFEYNSGWHG